MGERHSAAALCEPVETLLRLAVEFNHDSCSRFRNRYMRHSPSHNDCETQKCGLEIDRLRQVENERDGERQIRGRARMRDKLSQATCPERERW